MILPAARLVSPEQNDRTSCAHCAAFSAGRSTGLTPSPDPAFSPVTLMRRRAADRVLSHYRMNLADWQGSAFVLSTATGKTEIVDNLAHLWMAAERLLGRSCDPLDEELIALMERELG
jgi:hypothetical protein